MALMSRRSVLRGLLGGVGLLVGGRRAAAKEAAVAGVAPFNLPKSESDC